MSQDTNITGTEAGLDLDKAGFEVWAREACNMPPDVAINWNAVWTEAAYEGWQAALIALARRAAPATSDGEYSVFALDPLDPSAPVYRGDQAELVSFLHDVQQHIEGQPDLTERLRTVWRIATAPATTGSAAQPVPAGEAVEQARADFIEQIVLGVAEIPDRDSPEDQPEMMLVTTEELRAIVVNAFETADEARASLAPVSALPGYKLVPLEPTPEMQQAGFDTPGAHAYNASYRAMVAAAPVSAQQGVAVASRTLFALKRDSFVSETAFGIYQAEIEGWRTKHDATKAPAAQAVDLSKVPLHFKEGVENGGYYLATDVIRALALAASPASTPEAAPEQQQAKPVARLQEEISDRPFSEGKAHFEIVILDRARCFDGMELFAAPTAGAATTDAWHEAVLAECMRIEAAYIATDPAKTLTGLINWHVQNERDIGANILAVERGNFVCKACPAGAAATSEDALEQLLIEHRIGLTPENEGGFHAEVYSDQETPKAKGYGQTPREAVDAAMSAHQAKKTEGA